MFLYTSGRGRKIEAMVPRRRGTNFLKEKENSERRREGRPILMDGWWRFPCYLPLEPLLLLGFVFFFLDLYSSGDDLNLFPFLIAFGRGGKRKWANKVLDDTIELWRRVKWRRPARVRIHHGDQKQLKLRHRCWLIDGIMHIEWDQGELMPTVGNLHPRPPLDDLI